jgi:hypothetical protein
LRMDLFVFEPEQPRAQWVSVRDSGIDDLKLTIYQLLAQILLVLALYEEFVLRKWECVHTSIDVFVKENL